MIGARAAPRSIPAVWIALLGIVFLALVASVALLISADHLPARHVDLDRSRLVKTAAGTHLTLVLRNAPSHGQIAHTVLEPDERGQAVVEIRLSAVVGPASAVSDEDRRTLEIDLPDITQVRVLDLRFGRDESVDIPLSGS